MQTISRAILTYYFYGMKFFLRSVLVVLIAASISAFVIPGKLRKAFEALEVYNYFEAKELFYKSLKNDSVPASYGLSVIYSRSDNPFTNIDSAHKFINVAERNFNLIDSTIFSEYALFGLDSSALADQISVVDSLGFSRAKRARTVQSWNAFISDFDDPIRRIAAVRIRDSLAFSQALKVDSAYEYLQFYKEYPNSRQSYESLKLYHLRLFQEFTEEGTIEVFRAFLLKYPESPYRSVAQEKVYFLQTADGEVDSYLRFITENPDNSFVNDAWARIYVKEVKQVNPESIARFTLKYPDYPFMEDLKREFDLAVTRYYPITNGEKWGFADESGKKVIDFRFEWIEGFSDGFAQVGVENGVAYIDKSGKIINIEAFDDGYAFTNGFAIVEKDGFYGIINREGEYLVTPEYDDIGEYSEGLFYAEKGSLFGFFNEKADLIIPFQFSDATSFNVGMAVVSDSTGKKALIDKSGLLRTDFVFDWIEPFSTSELPTRFKLEGNYGLINREGQIINDTVYAGLGAFGDGLVMVVSESSYGYLNALGDTIIPFRYDFKEKALKESIFQSGFAKVFQKDKVGIIDTTGAKVFPAIFEDIGRFEGKLIPIKKRGKWGYADLDVNLAIPYNYSSAQNFRDTTAIVSLKGKFGLIDTLGNPIISPVFTNLERLDSLLIARNDSTWGLLELSGDTLLPFEYVKIDVLDKHVIRLERLKGGFEYFNFRSMKFIWREESE